MEQNESVPSLPNDGDTLRSEYDFPQAVRGKYFRRSVEGSGVVILEPDVAAAFPDSESVNRALRLLIEVAHREAGERIVAEKGAKYDAR